MAFFWDILPRFAHLHTLNLNFAIELEADVELEALALSQCKTLTSVHPVAPRSFEDLYCVGCLIASPSRSLIQDFGFLDLYSFACNMTVPPLSDAQILFFSCKLSNFPALTTLYSSDLVSPQQLHFISEAIPQLRSLILAYCTPKPESPLDFVPVATALFPILHSLDITLLIDHSTCPGFHSREFVLSKKQLRDRFSAARPSSFSLTVRDYFS